MANVLEAYCSQGLHWPEKIIVYTTDETFADLYELGVLFTGEGKPTNCWGDGTAGVQEEVRKEAESNLGLSFCAEHQTVVEWRHRGNMAKSIFYCPLCGKVLTLTFNGRVMLAACDRHDWVIHYESPDSDEVESLEYMGDRGREKL